jgi:hypothetical protein
LKDYKKYSKWERNQPKLKWKPLNPTVTEKPEEEESRPSPSTSTRCSSKYTPTLVSQRKPWTSWTHSFMTPSTESPLKDQSWLDSTKEELSLPVKFNPLSSSSSPENLLDTPCLREPKLSLNTSNNDILSTVILLNHYY